MLAIIGLGLWNEKSMSLEALEEAKKCDVLFAEFYTSSLLGTEIEKIEWAIGKKIKVLLREEVEKGKIILEAAKKLKVGFLVAGDALTATTHIEMLLEAKKLGIETKVLHGTSVYTTAPGLAGLQIYKFGRAASVPFPQEKFKVFSPYEILVQNKKIGAHTLVFLDLKDGKFMTANEGMRILLEIEKKKRKKVFTEKTKVVVVARAGSETPLVKYGSVKDLIGFDFGSPMHVLIVPARLHFKEGEFLETLK